MRYLHEFLTGSMGIQVKQFLKLMLIAGLMVLISGCSDATIDTSTEEKFVNSIKEVISPLSDEERDELQASLYRIKMYEWNKTDPFDKESNDSVGQRYYDRIDGLTADQVNALAKQLSP